MAGSLVAFALLHGGPGLPVMHNAVYDILIGGDCDVLPEIDMCIMDVDQRGKFQAVSFISVVALQFSAIPISKGHIMISHFKITFISISHSLILSVISCWSTI